jgi:hypothetical protein
MATGDGRRLPAGVWVPDGALPNVQLKVVARGGEPRAAALAA